MHRRTMLTGAGLAGITAALPPELLAAQSQSQGNAVSADAAPAGPEPTAKHRIKFGVIGLDHAHIYGMTDAMIRGGGTPTAFFATDAKQIATFQKRYLLPSFIFLLPVCLDAWTRLPGARLRRALEATGEAPDEDRSPEQIQAAIDPAPAHHT